ncbi:MAG: tetratricopeptide repeat protein [Actinobacteria bacterium]|nr:tetratricopeptide repeat protein [Actinomycetota bacterium]
MHEAKRLLDDADAEHQRCVGERHAASRCATALARLAGLYAREGRHDEAIACYREQVEEAKGGGYAAIDVESLLALADIYRARETHDLALETLRRSLRLQPHSEALRRIVADLESDRP